MTNPILYEDMTIRTSHPEIYEEFVDNKKLFKRSIHLFTTALTIGVIMDRKGQKKPYHDLIRFSTIRDKEQKIMINILARLAVKGQDKKERGNLLQAYADGGLEMLWEEYQDAGNLDVPRLLEEVKNRCTELTPTFMKAIQQK